eukprot:CAMPEP_0116900210 /NCGR_PEP_ID=MMETSP0467-20121206/8572_1 /TAXON_ID=283647 /ORGANISM="Mesodinium pulex, Strain SPMC105" /LENGTH=61 /DNA_ID=CAMNT_0004573389 /DNA_START=2707 /DNA_END=2892 /DNA_ORIENTATION=-
MEDPVMLPSSEVIVDRHNIVRHLLSDKMDPYTRAPLTIEELVPRDDIKKKIEEYKKEKKMK